MSARSKKLTDQSRRGILRLARRGLTPKEIARELGLPGRVVAGLYTLLVRSGQIRPRKPRKTPLEPGSVPRSTPVSGVPRSAGTGERGKCYPSTHVPKPHIPVQPEQDDLESKSAVIDYLRESTRDRHESEIQNIKTRREADEARHKREMRGIEESSQRRTQWLRELAAQSSKFADEVIKSEKELWHEALRLYDEPVLTPKNQANDNDSPSEESEEEDYEEDFEEEKDPCEDCLCFNFTEGCVADFCEEMDDPENWDPRILDNPKALLGPVYQEDLDACDECKNYSCILGHCRLNYCHFEPKY